jgi:Mg-chelatase subunit ChlD
VPFSFERPVLLVIFPAALVLGWVLSRRLRRGRTARAAIRGLALAALAIALAGPLAAGGAPPVRVELVDVSASFRGRRARGEEFLRRLGEASARRAPRGTAPEIVRVPFGAGVGEGAGPGGTDLAQAIRAAAALAAGGGEAVLVSDGLATVPGTLEAARAAGAAGVPIHVYLPPDPALPSLAIEEVRVPPRVPRGASVRVEVAIVWNGLVAGPFEDPPAGLARGAPLRVALAVKGEGFDSAGEAELPAGGGRAVAALDLMREATARPGLVEIAVEAHSPLRSDPVPEDERARAAFFVEGPRRVLVASEDGRARAATGQFEAELRAPAALPTDAFDLAPFSAIVVDEVPARALSPAQMRAIEEYVAEGGGLLAIGARRAFGPGGWDGTPLERALPVLSRPPPRPDERAAVAVLLDRSGSMSEEARPGVSKLVAAARALDPLRRLGPEDRLLVLVFSTKFEVFRALGPPGDVAALERALEAIEPGGGTDIFPAIEAAFEALGAVRAGWKHAVLVSDGRSDATPDRAAALARLADLRAKWPAITLSVVAVGADADEALLSEAASAGGGRFLRAGAGTAALEEALARELDPRSDLYVPGPHAVRVGDVGKLGADLAALIGEKPPPVADAARVEAREGAQVALVIPEVGPLLAIRPSGLGSAAAFASGDAGAYGAVLGLVLGSLARPESAPGVTFRATTDPDAPDRALLEADVREPGGAFARGRRLEAALGGPAVALEEAAPGLYRASLPSPERPALATLFDSGAGRRVLATAVFSPPRPLEYAAGPPDRALLREIAASSGGRVLEDVDADRGLAAPPRRGSRPIARFFSIAGAALFFLDLFLEALLTARAARR